MDPQHHIDPHFHSAVARQLHALAVAFSRTDVVLAGRLGLGSTDYLAMKHLLTTTDTLGPAELGKLLGISSGSATGLVDRLERAGHVRREPHPADRRRLVVRATPATATRILAELSPLADALDALTGGLDARDRAVVERFLDAVLDRHRTFNDGPPGEDPEGAEGPPADGGVRTAG